MNRIILIALLALAYVPTVLATTMFTVANRGGGLIQFTNIPCPNNEPNQWRVFTAGRGGEITSWGCWIFNGVDGGLLVEWNDGSMYTYPSEDVMVTEDFRALMRSGGHDL